MPLSPLKCWLAVPPAAATQPVPLDTATGVILLVCAAGALFAFVTLIARILLDETVPPPPCAPRPDPYPHPYVHPGISTFASWRVLPPSSMGAAPGWRIERAPVTAPTNTPTSAPAPVPARWPTTWPASWPAAAAPEAPRTRTALAAWTPLRVDPRVYSLN